MSKELTGMLHLKLEPVGVFFGNTSIQCDFDASPSRRNCVVPLLAAAANGRTISMNEDSCNCPGGATGCCFGDGFTRKNPNIHKMLSQGYGSDASGPFEAQIFHTGKTAQIPDETRQRTNPG